MVDPSVMLVLVLFARFFDRATRLLGEGEGEMGVDRDGETGQECLFCDSLLSARSLFDFVSALSCACALLRRITFFDFRH